MWNVLLLLLVVCFCIFPSIRTAWIFCRLLSLSLSLFYTFMRLESPSSQPSSSMPACLYIVYSIFEVYSFCTVWVEFSFGLILTEFYFSCVCPFALFYSPIHVFTRVFFLLMLTLSLLFTVIFHCAQTIAWNYLREMYIYRQNKRKTQKKYIWYCVYFYYTELVKTTHVQCITSNIYIVQWMCSFYSLPCCRRCCPRRCRHCHHPKLYLP